MKGLHIMKSIIPILLNGSAQLREAFDRDIESMKEPDKKAINKRNRLKKLARIAKKYGF